MRHSFVLLYFLVALGAAAQRSPFNGLEVRPADSTGAYTILFGGHFHGASTDRSGFPAATLLANLDTINALQVNMVLSTGDLFLNADKDSARYARSLFHELQAPLFNAPGNHDVEGRTYLRSYGPNFMVIDIGEDRVILLDTERDNGDIKGEQLRMLQEQADETKGFHGRDLFIVSHRPIWAEGDKRYSPLFAGNTRGLVESNYRKEVLPLVERIAQRAHVHWVSGSMAGMAPSSVFFQQHTPGITYIQSAIRNEPRDALLLARKQGGRLSWSTISLTGQQLLPAEGYDAAYWEEHTGKAEPFNWRLVPYLIKRTLQRPEFWYGILVAALLGRAVRWLFRRWL